MDSNWFYENIVAYRKGDLVDADKARFERLLEESGEFRGALEASEMLDRVESDTAGLIPTGVLSRWEEITPKMDDTERELVERHLERNAESRQDLELLGLSHAAPETKSVHDASIRGELENRVLGVRRWLAWAMGLYGATATAMIVFLLLRLPASGPETAWEGLSAPINILQTTRGSETAVITVASGADYLVLSPSGQNLDPGHRQLTLRLLDSNDSIIYTDDATLDAGDEPRRIVVVVPNPGPWRAGRYRLTAEDPATGQILSEYAFELRVQRKSLPTPE